MYVYMMIPFFQKIVELGEISYFINKAIRIETK